MSYIKEEFEVRFQREAVMMKQLNENVNIADYYDYFEEEGQPYLILEYVNGIALDRYLREVHDPTNELEVFEIFQQILLACQFAHSEGVVHRDLKPSNILITDKKKVKILDFGIAKAVNMESNSKLTRTGVQMEVI